MQGKKDFKEKLHNLLVRWKIGLFMRNAVPRSIQVTILISFTVVALVCMLGMGIALYERFLVRSERMLTESAQLTLDQTVLNLEVYLRNMRRMSDAIYYNVIKDQDMNVSSPIEQMDFLYEANKDYLTSLALYTEEGELLSASPVGVEKPGVDVTEQNWFK
ncbi:MAG: sensor histidine kinase, partial [Lachnospiraceae bacterium]|nr:sensor histidine kinase [Lachnospiraceae bacterium]